MDLYLNTESNDSIYTIFHIHDLNVCIQKTNTNFLVYSFKENFLDNSLIEILAFPLEKGYNTPLGYCLTHDLLKTPKVRPSFQKIVDSSLFKLYTKHFITIKEKDFFLVRKSSFFEGIGVDIRYNFVWHEDFLKVCEDYFGKTTLKYL